MPPISSRSEDPSDLESQILTSYLLGPSTLPTILPFDRFISLFPNAHRTNPTLRTLYRDLQFLRSIDIDHVRENIEHEVQRGEKQRRTLSRKVAKEMNAAGHETSAAENRMSQNGNDKKRKRDDNSTPAPGLPSESDVLLDTAMLLNNYQTHNNDPLTFSLSTSNTSQSQYHTLPSLLTALSTAVADLTRETHDAEREADTLLREMQETVGGLSDLRYGKFAVRPSLQSDHIDSGTRDGNEKGRGLEAEILRGLNDLSEVCGRKMVSSQRQEERLRK